MLITPYMKKVNNIFIKDIVFSFIIVSIPFIEFLNTNAYEINIQVVKTLSIFFIICIFLIYIFSPILNLIVKKKFLATNIFLSISFYFFFRYHDLINYTFFLDENLRAYFTVFIIFILILFLIYITFIKKNIFVLNFLKIYLLILFCYNFSILSYQIILNETQFKNLESEKNYNSNFDIGEFDNTTDINKKFENIYYVILDGAISIELFEKIYGNNHPNLKKIKNIKNYQYLPNSFSSYTDTGLTVGSIFNLEYIYFEDEQIIENARLYPTLLSKKNLKRFPSNLITYLNNFGYEFIWVSNLFMTCTVINYDLCLSSRISKDKNYLDIIIDFYVLDNFLRKSPIIGAINKFYPNYIIARQYKANDAINKFLIQIENYNYNNKPHFFLIHHMMPHPPYVFGKECEMTNNKGAVTKGYKFNYMCTIKRILEFVNYIEMNDPNGLVVIQADHGYPFINNEVVKVREENYTNEQFLLSKSSILNLIKISNNCTESITNQLDNVNTIRLVMACATKKDFKFVKKRRS